MAKTRGGGRSRRTAARRPISGLSLSRPESDEDDDHDDEVLDHDDESGSAAPKIRRDGSKTAARNAALAEAAAAKAKRAESLAAKAESDARILHARAAAAEGRWGG